MHIVESKLKLTPSVHVVCTWSAQFLIILYMYCAPRAQQVHFCVNISSDSTVVWLRVFAVNLQNYLIL